MVGLDTFEDFAIYYRKLLKEASVTEQKQLVQKFIKKVEVGTETVKIHFIVDEEHFKRELALKGAGSNASDFGSSRLMVGSS